MATTSVRTLLKMTRALIEQGWTRGTAARHGTRVVSVYDEKADRFCLLGALRRASGGATTGTYAKVYDLLWHNVPGALDNIRVGRNPIATFNDKQTKKQTVLDFLDSLIAQKK